MLRDWLRRRFPGRYWYTCDGCGELINRRWDGRATPRIERRSAPAIGALPARARLFIQMYCPRCATLLASPSEGGAK